MSPPRGTGSNPGISRAACKYCTSPLPAPSIPGKLDPGNARYVLNMLDRAVAGCRKGEFSGLVTAPVQQGVINDAGIAFTGHTEYLAQLTDSEAVMLLVGGGMRVALATTHLPLKDVPAAITRDALEHKLRIIHTDLIELVPLLPGLVSPWQD